MKNSILTIIIVLAVILTAMSYTMFDSIEIKFLVTLMDLPLVVLIADHLNKDND